MRACGDGLYRMRVTRCFNIWASGVNSGVLGVSKAPSSSAQSAHDDIASGVVNLVIASSFDHLPIVPDEQEILDRHGFEVRAEGINPESAV